jgi:GAF domain-containing protein/HAMP domain-containing protein
MVVVTVASITLLAIRREQQTFQVELQQQAELLLEALTVVASDPLYNLDTNFLSDMLLRLGEGQTLVSGRAYDGQGRVIADAYDPTAAFRFESDPFGQRLLASDTTVFDWQTDQLLAGRVAIVGGQKLGAISIGLPTAPLEAKVAAVRNQGLGVALAAAITGILLALLLNRSILGPLQELVRATEHLAEGDFTRKITIRGSKEIEALVGALNNMTSQLQQTLESLQSHTQHLEIVASLSGRLSAILNLEELLAEVVNQLKDKFGYYHVHIYLLDDEKEKLIVAEGTGAAGAEMKARGHSIPLNAPSSLVAHAARTGQIVKVDDVREEADWLPNPLLPDTYSEMAAPIIAEGEVVGVLGVQHDKIAGLDENDANMLHSLANQVAIAIRNARQFAAVEAALAEARALQQLYIAQSWDRTRIAKKNVGRVQFSLGESTTLNETVIVQARQQALASQELTLVTFNGSAAEATASPSASTSHALVAPLKLRHVPIGDVQLHDIDPDRKWTEGELALINAIIDQVVQAAENLRLLDETQERASRQELLNQIADKMRRAPDMESLMKVAVTELSRVLEPARTFVRLDPTAEKEHGQVAEALEAESVETVLSD